MPRVCYDKPNRSKDRPFTPKDAGRIAKYAKQHGETPELVLAFVLIGLGLQGEWMKIRRVYRGVRIMASAFSAYLALTRLKLIARGVIAIIAEIAERMREFPTLEYKNISVLGETVTILRTVIALIGGVVSAFRLVLVYDSEFVDTVAAHLSALGYEDYGAEEADAMLRSVLSNDESNQGER